MIVRLTSSLSHLGPRSTLASGIRCIILSDHAARPGYLRGEKKTIRVPFVPFTFIMTTPDGAWTYGSLFGRRRWGPRFAAPNELTARPRLTKGDTN
jgi:hypothetical protein